tara:strand:+ start:582 stop:704 length:123 start_codon:yes stop_codon:yes gene_type:complete
MTKREWLLGAMGKLGSLKPTVENGPIIPKRVDVGRELEDD